MSSFNDTIDLERALLRRLTESVILARLYLHQLKEEDFTSTERQFIFAIAQQVLQESNSALSRTMFEYAVHSRIGDSDAAFFITEWNVIENVVIQDTPEALIVKIRQAGRGRKALSITEDVVEMLEKGQIEEAVAHLKRESMMIGGQQVDRPVVVLTDIRDRLALIQDKKANPNKYAGIKIGFERFDKLTGGLFPGELTLIAGITGIGKSTLCRSIAKGVVTLNGARNLLHIANEEYLEQVQYKYDSLFTGIPYLDFKLAKIEPVALDRLQKYMQQNMAASGHCQIFVKEVPAFTDVSLIEQAYRILENRGIPIHAIIIDHLPHVKPLQQAWGENDERAKAATDCKEIARWLHVPVIVPTQAATEVEKKQMSGKRAGKLDVYGSKGQIHVSNTFIIITYVGTDEEQKNVEEWERDVIWLADVKKNRDGPPFTFNLKHRVVDGLVQQIELGKKSEGKEVADQVVKESDQRAAVAESESKLRDEQMKTMEAIDGGEAEPETEPKSPDGMTQLAGSVINQVTNDDRLREAAEHRASTSMMEKVRLARKSSPSGV